MVESAEKTVDLRLVGFGGHYFGDEENVTVKLPIFESNIEPEFVYGAVAPNWSFCPFNFDPNFEPSRYDNKNQLVKTLKINMGKRGGWDFNEFVDGFSKMNVSVSAGDSLLFYGPTYIEALKILNIERPMPDLVTKEGFDVIKAKHKDCEEAIFEYGEEGLRVLKDEVRNSEFGQDNELMKAADLIIGVNSKIDDNERILTGLAYRIQKMEKPEVILRFLAVYCAREKLSEIELYNKGLGYLKNLKAESLTTQDLENLEKFNEKIKTVVDKFLEELSKNR